MYNIWFFLERGFDLEVDLYPLIQTFINAHLAVYFGRGIQPPKVLKEYNAKCNTFTVTSKVVEAVPIIRSVSAN